MRNAGVTGGKAGIVVQQTGGEGRSGQQSRKTIELRTMCQSVCGSMQEIGRYGMIRSDGADRVAKHVDDNILEVGGSMWAKTGRKRQRADTNS